MGNHWWSLVIALSDLAGPGAVRQRKKGNCQPSHPGENCTEAMTVQHLCWKNPCETVKQVCSGCDQCQCSKRQTIKHSELPTKWLRWYPGGQHAWPNWACNLASMWSENYLKMWAVTATAENQQWSVKLYLQRMWMLSHWKHSTKTKEQNKSAFCWCEEFS